MDNLWIRRAAQELFDLEVDSADTAVLSESIRSLRKLVREVETVELPYLAEPFVAPGRDEWLGERSDDERL